MKHLNHAHIFVGRHLDANFGNKCTDLHFKQCNLDNNDLLAPVSISI